MSAKEINKRSKAIATSARALGKEIQTHLVTIMKHCLSDNANGDVSTAVNFVRYLSEMKDGESHSIVRVNAVRAWLAMFVPVKFGTDDDGNTTGKLNASGLEAMRNDPAHIKTGAKTYWNKLSPEKPEPIFDFEARLKSLIGNAAERVNAKTKEGKEHKVTADQVAALREFAKQYGIDA